MLLESSEHTILRIDYHFPRHENSTQACGSEFLRGVTYKRLRDPSVSP